MRREFVIQVTRAYGAVLFFYQDRDGEVTWRDDPSGARRFSYRDAMGILSVIEHMNAFGKPGPFLRAASGVSLEQPRVRVAFDLMEVKYDFHPNSTLTLEVFLETLEEREARRQVALSKLTFEERQLLEI